VKKTGKVRRIGMGCGQEKKNNHCDMCYSAYH
jgi:hypothetical protein